MIELKNVCYSYNGKTVLENISFRISRNERVVLLGVNGCGKTTLLKILNGLIFPQKGEYLFEGGEVSKAFLRDEDRRKKVKKSLFYIVFCLLLKDASNFYSLKERGIKLVSQQGSGLLQG